MPMPNIFQYLLDRVAVAILATALSVCMAKAEPIYSNLGSVGAYATSGVNFSTGLGNAFTADRTAVIGRIEVPLAAVQTGATTSVTIAIIPTTIGSTTVLWSATNSAVSAPGLYTFVSASADPVTLTAGQQYYITAVPSGGNATWFNVSTGQTSLNVIYSCLAPQFCFWQPDTSGSPLFTPALAFRISEMEGACCSAKTGGCLVLPPADCAGVGLVYTSSTITTCSPNPCHACPGDFNGSGRATVQDIFDFLAAWFAGCP